ncbi:hypothetical protein Tco_0962517 [Tanacetum coccineum]
MIGFILDTLSKEAQTVLITDCQAGNPCEIRYDLTGLRLLFQSLRECTDKIGEAISAPRGLEDLEDGYK